MVSKITTWTSWNGSTRVDGRKSRDGLGRDDDDDDDDNDYGSGRASAARSEPLFAEIVRPDGTRGNREEDGWTRQRGG